MNWFVSEPASADSLLQASLPFVEVFCALVGIIAVLMLLIALLHTCFAVRSSNSHPELYPFGIAKQRVVRVSEALHPVRAKTWSQSGRSALHRLPFRAHNGNPR
jgi:hypothetical protein